MAWPEHPYISAYMVVQSASEKADAIRAAHCFYDQTWPVKQLVIVNGTQVPMALRDKRVKEVLLRSTRLGDLKNAALMATDGEWCFPWSPNGWYAPDYLKFMMASADPRVPLVIQNPYVENGEILETTPDRVAFFNFFKPQLSLPAYDASGSDTVFLSKFIAAQRISQVSVMAKHLVSSTEILKLLAEQPARTKIKKKTSVCIVQLGRYGDLINILPLALHIHNTYGKPYVMISREFQPLFDGVSYAEPFPVDLKCDRINEAMAIARCSFEFPIQTQIWGHGYDQVKLTEGYNKEMWRMGGFLPWFNDPTWRPLFDTAKLPGLKHLPVRLTGKPLMLTNLTCGASSPFPEGPELLKEVMEHWGETYQVLEIGTLRLPHIYDLLPLIQAAKLMVSIDTALLHLAAATNTPVVALVNPHPWLGTICRGVTAARFDYNQVRQSRELVHQGIQSAIGLVKPELPAQVLPCAAPQRKQFHSIAKYEEPVAAERKRKQFAIDSWAGLYKGGVIPAYYTEWKRSLAHINSKARLPYLKDLLEPALAQAADHDIIIYTNDDIICHPALPEQMAFYCGIWGCVAARRCEGSVPLPLTASPDEWRQAAQNADYKHYGRDLFAFTKAWLKAHWEELPDFVIGSTDWDNCLVAMIRRTSGYKTDPLSLRELIWPAEMPLGWTCHVWHKSMWQTFGNYWSSPGNVNNRELFKAWSENYASHLVFDRNNLLV